MSFDSPTSPPHERGGAEPQDGFFELLLADVKAKSQWCYESTSWKAMLKTCVTDGTFAMLMYRLMQWSRRWRLVPIEMICNKLNAVLGQCLIGRGAQFGPGFVLIHSQGVVINGSVRGGSHIYVEHQVTIGAERNQSPMLGSNIFIGAGAKIVGSVRVADGARIGANAVVVDDVAAHTTVVGIPARAVRSRQESLKDTE